MKNVDLTFFQFEIPRQGRGNFVANLARHHRSMEQGAKKDPLGRERGGGGPNTAKKGQK